MMIDPDPVDSSNMHASGSFNLPQFRHPELSSGQHFRATSRHVLLDARAVARVVEGEAARVDLNGGWNEIRVQQSSRV